MYVCVMWHIWTSVTTIMQNTQWQTSTSMETVTTVIQEETYSETTRFGGFTVPPTYDSSLTLTLNSSEVLLWSYYWVLLLKSRRPSRPLLRYTTEDVQTSQREDSKGGWSKGYPNKSKEGVKEWSKGFANKSKGGFKKWSKGWPNKSKEGSKKWSKGPPFESSLWLVWTSVLSTIFWPLLLTCLDIPSTVLEEVSRLSLDTHRREVSGANDTDNRSCKNHCFKKTVCLL